MKKLILLLLFPFSAISQYTSIPDANFEQSLINYGYDFIPDGFVETSAIDTVTDLTINNNDRVAQMILTPIKKMDREEVENLPDTLRGKGGFGSTGK